MKKLVKVGALLGATLLSHTSHALIINLNPAAGMSADAYAGFRAAADRWEGLLNDKVTVNLDIGYAALSPGVLAQAGSTRGTISYAGFRNAMINDAKSWVDSQAVMSLPAGNCVDIYLNRTSNNPNGAGSATPYVDSDCDANNSTIRMTWANARALGLAPAQDNTRDATLTFSSLFSWDFNPADGILATAFDFIGVATHEIGHALGFISGIDVLDTNSSGPYFRDDQFTYVAPGDMFRCSAASAAAGADIDFTADKRAKYFSFDGCATMLTSFSTGRVWGDGRQASHWQDNHGIGILDPTAGYGELLEISAFDKMYFDAIGWDVPEPGTLALFGLAGLALIRRRRMA